VEPDFPISIMKPTDKKRTPEHCKLLYSKDFYTASNFYPKIFQLFKKLHLL